jgi:hypothetical protein
LLATAGEDALASVKRGDALLFELAGEFLPPPVTDFVCSIIHFSADSLLRSFTEVWAASCVSRIWRLYCSAMAPAAVGVGAGGCGLNEDMDLEDFDDLIRGLKSRGLPTGVGAFDCGVRMTFGLGERVDLRFDSLEEVRAFLLLKRGGG